MYIHTYVYIYIHTHTYIYTCDEVHVYLETLRFLVYPRFSGPWYVHLPAAQESRLLMQPLNPPSDLYGEAMGSRC